MKGEGERERERDRERKREEEQNSIESINQTKEQRFLGDETKGY